MEKFLVIVEGRKYRGIVVLVVLKISFSRRIRGLAVESIINKGDLS